LERGRREEVGRLEKERGNEGWLIAEKKEHRRK
jgi:hypothetical protein